VSSETAFPHDQDDAHKLWKAARRAGHEIGRDQTARLMRELGIKGISRRRKRFFTTVANPDATRAPDLVNRQFRADRPDALWVTDLTYVPTRSGMAYVCFIVDAFSRRIVGWRVASNMRTEMVLDALEMARRSRGGRRLVGLITHSDAGSQPSSRPCASPSASTRSAPGPASAPWRTVSTTPWRNDERPLQGRVRLRARRRRLERRRRARARHPVVGALVQRAPPPWTLRRRATGGVRGSVLRCPSGRPRRGWNPIARASIRPRAIQVPLDA
jgi:hypothetical protein